MKFRVIAKKSLIFKKKYDRYDKYIIYFIKIFIICFNYINIFRKDINEKWR